MDPSDEIDAAAHRWFSKAWPYLRTALAGDESLREATASLLTLLSPEPPAEEPPAAQPVEAAPQPKVDQELRLGDVRSSVRVIEESPAATPLPPAPLTAAVKNTAGEHAVPPAIPWAPPEERQLDEILTRCEHKARMCRWQVERRQLRQEGVDVSDRDDQLLSIGKREQIFFWMKGPDRWRSDDDASHHIVADAFQALAEAIGLTQLAETSAGRNAFEAAVHLLAETQLALREIVAAHTYQDTDDEQAAVFRWLRRVCREQDIYVELLRRDSTFDEGDLPDLRNRIGEALRPLKDLKTQSIKRDQLWKKLDFHLAKVNQQPAELTRAWAIVDDLLQAGVAESSPAFRDRLTPWLDEASHDLPRPVGRVIDEVRQWMLDEPNDDETAAASDADALVQRARDLVKGKVAVLLGGQARELHRQRIEQELGLRELRWETVAHHQSFDDVAGPLIERGEVDLVLILTRWRSHRDGPAAREAARRRGIPLIELPGGYNERQIAHRIVEQM